MVSSAVEVSVSVMPLIFLEDIISSRFRAGSGQVQCSSLFLVLIFLYNILYHLDLGFKI